MSSTTNDIAPGALFDWYVGKTKSQHRYGLLVSVGTAVYVQGEKYTNHLASWHPTGR